MTGFALVTPVLPWPVDQGNRRFLFDVAQGLRSLGPVQWVTREVGDQADAIAHLTQTGFELRLDHSFARRDLWSRTLRRIRIDAAAWRHRRPRELYYTCTPQVMRLMTEAMSESPDTIAVAAFWYAAPALRLAPVGRRVLVLSDIEHDRLAEARGVDPATTQDGVVRRWREAELEAWDSADLVLCLTAEDRDRAARAWPRGRDRLGVWPAAHPVSETCPPLRSGGGPLRLLTFGHWQADFNRAGLLDFVDRVWPVLRERNPGTVLKVVGAGIDAQLRTHLEAAGCDVVGWVDSIEAELAACDAVVLNLTYGGGLRYRLLEAMAAGRPCICGGVAARGAGAEAGRHYVAAGDLDSWVQAVHRLHDGTVRARVADEAWRFVVDTYGGSGRADRLRHTPSSLPTSP